MLRYALALVGVLGLGLPAVGQECETKGLIESMGQGTPGTRGVPQLETVGVPLEGKALWFEVTNGRPGANGVILGSTSEAAVYLPPFRAILYPARPFHREVFSLDGAGQSRPLFQRKTVPDLCGRELVTQAAIRDPVATGGLAFSNAMRVRFSGPAEGPLFPGQSVPVDDGPWSVAIDDLDGDGMLDMAVTYYDSDYVSVLLGLGGGTFGAAQSFPAGTDSWFVAIDDLDGDGVPDMAVASSDGISVLLGHGDGTFAAAQSVPVGGGFIAIDDLDGDGVPDLVVTGFGQVSVLLGLGDGTFAAAQSVLASSWF